MNFEELRNRCAGVQAIVATPFQEDYDLDEDGLRSNVRYVLKHGVQMITTMGTNSEFYAVTPEEHRRAVKAVVDEARGTDTLIIVGASSTSTKLAIELSQYAEKTGAHAVMVAPPYYMPSKPKEIMCHYKAISDSIDIGIMLYYMPEVHRGHMTYDLLDELASLRNVIGVKWCELDLHPFTSAFRRLGKKISFVSGYGEYLAPYTYMIGVKGFSSTIAGYAPKLSLELHQAGINRNWEKVKDISLRSFSLYDFAVRTGAGIALTKEAMRIVGLVAGVFRPPMHSPLTDEDRKELARILEEMGVTRVPVEAF